MCIARTHHDVRRLCHVGREWQVDLQTYCDLPYNVLWPNLVAVVLSIADLKAHFLN